MATGTVKWFSPEKKFGFIVPDVAGDDVFVHISSIPSDCSLMDGDRVSYTIGQRKGKFCALDVRIANE